MTTKSWFLSQPSTKISPFSNFTLTTLIKLHHHPLFPSKSHKFSLKTHSSQTPDSPRSQPLTVVSMLRIIPDWADAIKERGMKQKKSLYNHEQWVQHRSSLRHLRHLFSSLSSRVILSLIPPVIAFTLWALAIASYNSVVTVHWLPDFLPVLRASPLPYQLTAPALALLLVFRTEASYSRYEEGRKAWTKVIVGANDFARQLIASVDDPSDVPLKKAILQYIMAFPVALKCHVIHESDFQQDLQNLLEVDDLAVVLSSNHRPRCIIEFISQSLHLLNIDEPKRLLLESKISCFHEGIGVCEQLIGVPIPLSYTRLTSRFLVLWHITLPIILWDECHWIVIPATFISAASLFCIEEVGDLIEEPFPMLALDEICNLTHNNIEEAIENENLIKTRLVAKQKSHLRVPSPNGRTALTGTE